MALAANRAKLVGHFPAVTDAGKEIPHYRITTNDNKATIEGAGWANVLVGQAPVGTILDIVADLDGTPTFLRYLVTANDGTDVTISVVTDTSQIVDVTTSTLTVTQALHGGKTMTLNRAAGIAVTLPVPTGSGTKYRFVVGTTFTGAASIKSASGADLMIGHALMGNNSDNTVVDWPALVGSTFDTIDLFGTANSTGGIAGQTIDIQDIAANRWHVAIRGDAAGTEATPFADSVA